jgi:hypothetical protein
MPMTASMMAKTRVLMVSPFQASRQKPVNNYLAAGANFSVIFFTALASSLRGILLQCSEVPQPSVHSKTGWGSAPNN